MKKVFLDTNVVLDFLLNRAPFSDDIAEIISLAEILSIQLCVSATCMTDTHYIMKRSEGFHLQIKKSKKS